MENENRKCSYMTNHWLNDLDFMLVILTWVLHRNLIVFYVVECFWYTHPTRQGWSIVRRIRSWRWEDDLIWARMKVFRMSFYVPASVERYSNVRFGRDVDAAYFIRPRRIRTSGKLSYGPKVGRPLNIRGGLAEWYIPVKNRYVYFSRPNFRSYVTIEGFHPTSKLMFKK